MPNAGVVVLAVATGVVVIVVAVAVVLVVLMGTVLMRGQQQQDEHRRGEAERHLEEAEGRVVRAEHERDVAREDAEDPGPQE